MKMRMIGMVLLALLLAVPAAAQESWFHMGIKGGLNWASTAIDPEPDSGDFGRLMGIGGGVALDMVFSPTLCLETDVLYMQKGSQVDYEFTVGSEGGGTRQWDVETTLAYIVVAPMLRFSVERDGAHPYALFGGEFGFLLSAEAEQHGDIEMTTDVKDNFKSSDMGLTFGGGVEIPTDSYSFFFEGRYTLGMTEIQDGDTEGASAAKHRGIYAFAGLRF